VVPHWVAGNSALYGTIGVVFALLLWLLVFGRIVVYLAVLEAQVGEAQVGEAQVGRGDAATSLRS